jgi:hypothetical protein
MISAVQAETAVRQLLAECWQPDISNSNVSLRRNAMSGIRSKCSIAEVLLVAEVKVVMGVMWFVFNWHKLVPRKGLLLTNDGISS